MGNVGTQTGGRCGGARRSGVRGAGGRGEGADGVALIDTNNSVGPASVVMAGPRGSEGVSVPMASPPLASL